MQNFCWDAPQAGDTGLHKVVEVVVLALRWITAVVSRIRISIKALAQLTLLCFCGSEFRRVPNKMRMNWLVHFSEDILRSVSLQIQSMSVRREGGLWSMLWDIQGEMGEQASPLQRVLVCKLASAANRWLFKPPCSLLFACRPQVSNLFLICWPHSKLRSHPHLTFKAPFFSPGILRTVVSPSQSCSSQAFFCRSGGGNYVLEDLWMVGMLPDSNQPPPLSSCGHQQTKAIQAHFWKPPCAC